MIKYRFKTEEEFIKEFGNNWWAKVDGYWAEGMNRFLGKPMKELNELEHSRIAFVDGWRISRDMVVENRQTVEPKFEDKKVILKFRENKVIATYGGYSATAQCNDEDEYNEDFGVAIALSRLARKIGEYETEKLVKVQEKHNILDEI